MATLQTWIACRILYKDKFQAAQEEIDRVVGEDRLPSFNDRLDLKRVEATVRETIRFRTPVPTGVPHAATQSVQVTVDGETYCIPPGALIFGTSWVIDKDPARFETPFDFNPEQQIDAHGQFKEHGMTAFGFGRRVCPGKLAFDLTSPSGIGSLTYESGQPHAERTLKSATKCHICCKY